MFRCLLWKTALGFTGNHKYADLTPEKCYSSLKICSLHFSDASFSNQAKNHLKQNAVPSLMLKKHSKLSKNIEKYILK